MGLPALIVPIYTYGEYLHAVQICLSVLSISILMLRSRTFFTILLPFPPNLNYAYSAVRTTESSIPFDGQTSVLQWSRAISRILKKKWRTHIVHDDTTGTNPGRTRISSQASGTLCARPTWNKKTSRSCWHHLRSYVISHWIFLSRSWLDALLLQMWCPHKIISEFGVGANFWDSNLSWLHFVTDILRLKWSYLKLLVASEGSINCLFMLD